MAPWRAASSTRIGSAVAAGAPRQDPHGRALRATTEQGLAVSTDGGRSFAPMAGAPLLQLVSWTDDGLLVGVAPDGATYLSDDEGQTWQQRANVQGQPEALTADGRQVFVALTGGTVVRSTNAGGSYQTMYTQES